MNFGFLVLFINCREIDTFFNCNYSSYKLWFCEYFLRGKTFIYLSNNIVSFLVVCLRKRVRILIRSTLVFFKKVTVASSSMLHYHLLVQRNWVVNHTVNLWLQYFLYVTHIRFLYRVYTL